MFLSGKGVFAALPTGYSKSLCYACLPLIVNQKAKFVGEAQCDPQVVESVCEGKAQLLFISSPIFRQGVCI